MKPEEVLQETVRGQYGPGVVEGKKALGYRQEPNVLPTSTVETFAAMKLAVENWRWAGIEAVAAGNVSRLGCGWSVVCVAWHGYTEHR